MADDKKKNWYHQPLKIVSLEVEALELKDGYWEFLIVAVVVRGNKTIDGETVCFCVEGVECGQSQTLENGRAVLPVDGIISKGTDHFSVTAQIAGQGSPARKIINLPKEEKKKEEDKPPEAAEFIVDPTRIGNKIILLARVVDEKGNNMKGVRLTLVEDSEVKHKKTDTYGNFLYSFELKPDEEREIAIYADGFAEEFRRTFKGRRIK